MRFFADAMLGRLAKWLRILGYDTLYESGIDDAELVRRARSESRLILTRDTRLTPGLVEGEYLFIRDNAPIDQLVQSVEELGLDADGPGFLTRCVECNSALEEADREALRGAVPEFTYHTVERFTRCPGCGRFYWHGTHTNRIRGRLRSARILR